MEFPCSVRTKAKRREFLNTHFSKFDLISDFFLGVCLLRVGIRRDKNFTYLAVNGKTEVPILERQPPLRGHLVTIFFSFPHRLLQPSLNALALNILPEVLGNAQCTMG